MFNVLKRKSLFMIAHLVLNQSKLILVLVDLLVVCAIKRYIYILLSL